MISHAFRQVSVGVRAAGGCDPDAYRAVPLARLRPQLGRADHRAVRSSIRPPSAPHHPLLPFPSAPFPAGFLMGLVCFRRLPDWAGPASVTSPLLGKAQPAVLHLLGLYLYLLSERDPSENL